MRPEQLCYPLYDSTFKVTFEKNPSNRNNARYLERKGGSGEGKKSEGLERGLSGEFQSGDSEGSVEGGPIFGP